MTHTKQFLQGMFAAYMGCECEITETQDNITTKTKAKSSGVLSERLHFAGVGLFVHFSKLKPILTTLSEITDEDAEVLGKYRYSDPKALNHIQIGKGIISDYLREDRVNGKFELEKFEIDYLRSKHYDLGYLGVDSLIKSGYAIESKKENPQINCG